MGGVRLRCAEHMKKTTKAARFLCMNAVNGFTGSPVRAEAYSFLPAPQTMIYAGFREFASPRRGDVELDPFTWVLNRLCHERLISGLLDIVGRL